MGGLAKDGDVDTFKRRREVELKNGRVAMFATLGWIVPQYFRFLGFLSPSQAVKFSDVPGGLQAFSKVPFLGWAQIVCSAAWLTSACTGRTHLATQGTTRTLASSAFPTRAGP